MLSAFGAHLETHNPLGNINCYQYLALIKLDHTNNIIAVSLRNQVYNNNTVNYTKSAYS